MMKKNITLLSLLTALLPAQSLSAQTKPSDTTIYRTVEQMPRFPGGMEALQKYFRENVRYPQSAIDGNIQGSVLIGFVIAQTGDIRGVSVIKSVDPALDSEAVSVIRAMPKWEPGEDKGRKVNVYYKVPINFRMQHTGENADANMPGSAIMDKAARSMDRLPQYPGGERQLINYITEHIQYPPEAVRKNIQGVVLLEFVVNKDGTITNIIPLKKLGGGCTEEAIRVLKLTSGIWTPGTEGGKLVNAKYNLPVTFKLQ
jgi:TonB family protein